MPRPENVRLGEILVRHKLLTPEQLERALEEQKHSGRQLGRVRRLGRILVEKGYVAEEGLAAALAAQLRLAYIDLRTYQVRPEVAHKLPELQARRCRALLLEISSASCKVGMSDPTDLNAYDELTRLFQREIEIAVVTESQLLEAINRVYRRTGEIRDLAQQLGATIGNTAAELAAASAPGMEDAPVAKLLQSVFEDATQVRASDVHIEPQEHKLVVRVRIDGVLSVQTEADARIGPALVSRLKLMSGLDISEKRLPQDGRFEVKTRFSTLDVRISTMPTQFGESVVMRLLNQGGGLLTLDKLGLPPRIHERLEAILARPNGAVLVTGPTGSGKTTTLYAALAHLNTVEHKIITVEDPVEYRLPGVCQVQVHEKIDLTFSRVLRSALRQDPDVILVGEMRDRETVETGLRAAMTGHLVLSTLHTNDALTTPMRLLDMGAPRYMVAFSLQMVIAQRLVRLVCQTCARPHPVLPGEREWLTQTVGADAAARRYFKGKGCSHCNGTGYHERTGVYEMLEMTRPVVEAMNHHDAAGYMHAASREIGTHTLRAHAAQLAVQGRTTVAEAMRVSTYLED
jgi:MSHA biogenesis protein MshE